MVIKGRLKIVSFDDEICTVLFTIIKTNEKLEMNFNLSDAKRLFSGVGVNETTIGYSDLCTCHINESRTKMTFMTELLKRARYWDGVANSGLLTKMDWNLDCHIS